MPTVREIEQAPVRAGSQGGRHGLGQRGPACWGTRRRGSPKVLVALDITEAAADEAVEKGCQLIVSHPPGDELQVAAGADRPAGHAPGAPCWLKLLKNDVSAICMHTNLDVAPGGVNDALAAALGLEDPGPLGDHGGAVPGGKAVKSHAFPGVCAARLPGAPRQRRPVRRRRRPPWRGSRLAAAPAATMRLTPSPPGATCLSPRI